MSYKRLNQDDLIKFIRSYKAKQCLWNKRNADYKNVMLKIKSYNQLSKEFDMNGLDVKRLINNLRKCFIREWELVNISNSCDSFLPYKPNVEWYDEMRFIVDSLLTNRKTNNAVIEHDYVEYLQEDDDEVYTVPNYPSEDAMSYTKYEADPPIKRSSSNLEISKFSYGNVSSANHISADASDYIDHLSLDIVKATTSNDNKNVINEDSLDSETNNEIDQFCKSLATQMMKLPVRSVIQLQMEIQNLISNKRLAELKIINSN